MPTSLPAITRGNSEATRSSLIPAAMKVTDSRALGLLRHKMIKGTAARDTSTANSGVMECITTTPLPQPRRDDGQDDLFHQRPDGQAQGDFSPKAAAIKGTSMDRGASVRAMALACSPCSPWPSCPPWPCLMGSKKAISKIRKNSTTLTRLEKSSAPTKPQCPRLQAAPG